MKRAFAILSILAVAAQIAAAGPFGIFRGRGSCGPNGCAVEPTQAASPGPTWKASQMANSANRYELWHQGKFLGFWDAREGYFRAWIGGDEWGPRVEQPPHPVPDRLRNLPAEEAQKPAFEAWQTNGVQREKCQADKDSYSINGRPATLFEAQSKMLDDDSQKLWLIVNGDGREKVLKDLQSDPSFADLLKRTRVWSVPANHFSLLDRETGKPMFPVGDPGIYFSLADGTELHKQVGYQGPADLEAIRKADPNWRPILPRKPDPKKPDPAPTPNAPDDGKPAPSPGPVLPKNALPWLMLAGGAFLSMFLRAKRKI